MKKPFLLIGLNLVFAAIPCLQAAVLLKYEFAGGSQAGSIVDPGVTAGTFGAGPNLVDLDNGASGGTLDYTAGWARIAPSRVIGASATPGNETDSKAGEEYFTFTIGPNSGGTLNLETLVFSTAYYGTTASTEASFFVRSSIDNFVINLGNTTFTSPLLTSAAFVEKTVTFTGASFQDLTGPVEFRIYLYDANNASNRSIAIDDVTVNGTFIPVPEPASCAFVFAAIGLAMTGRRR